MTNENEIIIFETEDKSISLPVRIENESVWLNRNQMAELFERDVKTIGKHRECQKSCVFGSPCFPR